MTSDLAERFASPGTGVAVWCCFDHQWYACAYPEAVEAAGGAEFETLRHHHMTHGERLGRSPNMYFDEDWYRTRNPDVAAAIAAGTLRSGYEHYCLHGYNDRSPHWLFQKDVYTPRIASRPAPDWQAQGCRNGYDHYLRHGAPAGRIAHLLFDPAIYRAALAHEPGADAAIERMGPVAHFLSRIWFERRDARTSLYFDNAWFLAKYPEAAARVDSEAATCALHAYLTGVGSARWNPLPQFDESFYLDAHPEVAAAVRSGVFSSGYDQFLRAGVFALRSPNAATDLRRIHDCDATMRVDLASGRCRDAFAHLLAAAGRDRPAQPHAHGAGALAMAAPVLVGGHVDSHGFAALAEGWLFVGWLPREAGIGVGAMHVTARFADTTMEGRGLLVTFPRSDVAEQGLGAVVFLPGEAATPGKLVEVEITTGQAAVRLPAGGADAVAGGISTTAQSCIAGAGDDPAAAELRVLLGRKPYAGGSTLGDLRDRLFLEIDELLVCPGLEPDQPGGLALCGWMLAVPGMVTRVRVRCGSRSAVVPFDKAIRLERQDVLEGVGVKHGLPELRSGFLVYVPDIVEHDEAPYLEVLTARGEIAYRSLPPPRLRGMEAMRFILERAELRYGEVAPGFDSFFGPSIQRLNADRLRAAPEFIVTDFGTPPAEPVLSVVVTLYGRLDFVEYQMAFFSRHQGEMPYELIYVLDDPPRRRQLENLAASVHARFGIPFRIVLLARNLGFAPANNVGLALARGEHVCFLNSDVFPGTPDWMEQMVARLRETPELGAVGPMLLFEDGSVQHQGMKFQRVPVFADWHFPMHPGKGWRPRQTAGLVRCQAITGACIVMATPLARELGGFDPSFAIGDFEDADLCLKLAARGLDCAVDTGVTLYHLERQSQAGSQHLWRMNLTLYNAWIHERRWGNVLAQADTTGPAATQRGEAA